jgi:four helix bundle protein
MSNGVNTFEDLEVWQLARDICVLVYKITNDKTCGWHRDFRFRDQIRDASISIASNIAEGFESRTVPLYIDFVGRAKGSAGEVRSQLNIANAIGYLNDAAFYQLDSTLRQCSRQLYALMSSLEKRR